MAKHTDTDIEKQKGALISAMARLQAHSGQIGEAREQLGQRAGEQLDSMSAPIQETSKRIEEGRAGGWLGHRRHLSLLDERQRLSVLRK